MHTIKLLLTYYLNISDKRQIYQIAESSRIETFFARIGMLYCSGQWSLQSTSVPAQLND